MTEHCTWTDFYMELATAFLPYKNRRSELIEILKIIFRDAGMNFPFKEKGIEFYEDICPFTIFGSINRGITDANRIILLTEFAKQFNVKSKIPTKFDGIPRVMNLTAWFFAYKIDRAPHDIENLWNLYEKAIQYSADSIGENKKQFISAYNTVRTQKCIKWNITMGLYWIRPLTFINLDLTNRTFISDPNSVSHEMTDIFSGVNNDKIPDGEDYLSMCERTRSLIERGDYPYHSFPELSYTAWESSSKNSKQSNVKNVAYWIYSPGHEAVMLEEFQRLGIMGVNCNKVSDLAEFSSKEFKNYMKKNIDPNYSYRNDAHCLWQFAKELKIGDIVFAKKGKQEIIGKGIVISDYIYDQSRSEYKHIRKVKWTNIGKWMYPDRPAAKKTLTNISSDPNYVQNLLNLFDEDTEEESSEKEIMYPAYTKDEFLNEVFMSEESYAELTQLLESKYNVILQGPPGVGKTYAAKRLAYSIIGQKDTDRVLTVQFHQSYSYEDFIQGLRPIENGFKLANGVFYNFCEKAKNDNENPYFFIIDEINRGNLSKIFGELMMLIEKDKRGECLELKYSGELFTVPDNVRLIGMMNTADRSLAFIDYALRRRFGFFDFAPAFETDGFKNYLENKSSSKLEELISVVEKLNDEISNDASLGEGFRIGHSYFYTENDITDNWIHSIVEYEIIPLLREYWFDEPDKIRRWSASLRGAVK